MVLVLVPALEVRPLGVVGALDLDEADHLDVVRERQFEVGNPNLSAVRMSRRIAGHQVCTVRKRPLSLPS